MGYIPQLSVQRWLLHILPKTQKKKTEEKFSLVLLNDDNNMDYILHFNNMLVFHTHTHTQTKI